MSNTAGAVYPGMILLWSGSIASIPSGWYLCDGNNGTPDLRGKFVVGAGDSYDVGATGGSATHTHSFTYSGGGSIGGGAFTAAGGNVKNTFQVSGSGITNPSSSLAVYYALAFIYCPFVGGVYPGTILMWSGSIASIPAGWHLCDGTGGTPDLKDRFIIGAGGTYNPGSTGGANTHMHSGTLSGTAGLESGAVLAVDHPNGTYDTYGNYSSGFSTTAPHPSNLPPYYALAYIQNVYDLTQGVYTGMITYWSGSIVSIPSGWYLCNGSNGTPNLRNRFVVCAGGTYSAGATGGAVSHNHISTGTGGGMTLAAGNKVKSGSDYHNSGGWAVTITFSQADHLPPYYALAYVMKG